MGIVLGGIAVVGLVALLIWGLVRPSQETAMGRENKARREARKAAKRVGVQDHPER
jgi:hypothetical protein